jgi:hypothetical protein
LRLKLDRAAISIEDLASKGPLKPEELRGLKDYDEYVKNEDITTINGLKKMPPRVGIREVPEETHYRTGWLLSAGAGVMSVMVPIVISSMGFFFLLSSFIIRGTTDI